MTITQQHVTDRLDRLEDSLPAIASKTVAFGRATARRTTDTVGAIIGDVSGRADNIGRSISTAGRTAVGQARSVADRSITTICNGTKEVMGQTRAQSGAVVESIEHEVEELLDTATDAVDPATQRPSSLADLSKGELYARAQTHDVPGRSTMTRDELVDALRA